MRIESLQDVEKNSLFKSIGYPIVHFSITFNYIFLIPFLEVSIHSFNESFTSYPWVLPFAFLSILAVILMSIFSMTFAENSLHAHEKSL